MPLGDVHMGNVPHEQALREIHIIVEYQLVCVVRNRIEGNLHLHPFLGSPPDGGVLLVLLEIRREWRIELHFFDDEIRPRCRKAGERIRQQRQRDERKLIHEGEGIDG